MKETSSRERTVSPASASLQEHPNRSSSPQSIGNDNVSLEPTCRQPPPDRSGPAWSQAPSIFAMQKGGVRPQQPDGSESAPLYWLQSIENLLNSHLSLQS
jgi:hypothetical protein